LGDAVLVTLAAQITTLPILIVTFRQVSLLTLFVNALVLPAQTGMMVFGGLALLVGSVGIGTPGSEPRVDVLVLDEVIDDESREACYTIPDASLARFLCAVSQPIPANGSRLRRAARHPA
jgi:predicted membrane metal-binding protein